jgi:hypothetical protein
VSWEIAKRRVKPAILPKITEANRGKTANPRLKCTGVRTTRRQSAAFRLAFSFSRERTPFHNKKPGAVTRPGICITLTDICFYMNLVTFVNIDDAGRTDDAEPHDALWSRERCRY